MCLFFLNKSTKFLFKKKKKHTRTHTQKEEDDFKFVIREIKSGIS